jgi:hypothetical protein
MASPPRRLCHRHQRLQARAQLKGQQRQAQEIKRQQLQAQRQYQEDQRVLAMLRFNVCESNHTTWVKCGPNFDMPLPLPKPAPSPTSTPTKPNSSRKPTTYTRSYWSFSRRRAEKRGQTKRGSVPFSRRKRINTPNSRLLIQLIIILCALPVFSAADLQSKSDFHLVFEEIGLMVSATDYQLATMKVNLTKLEETVLTFKDTVILQKRFIEQIPLPIIRQNQTIIPERYNEAMKNRLLTNTQANLDDAEALVYQIQQVK